MNRARLRRLLPLCACLLGGCSEDAGRKHVVEIVCPAYQPGLRAQSIGEPLRALREVADEYERLHPDVRIEFPLSSAGGQVEGEWIRTHLRGGIAPEIVQINVESVWPDVDKGWWVALDRFYTEGSPYHPGVKTWMDAFEYQALTRAKRGPDGRFYTVTLDVVETAVFYNKTVFRRVGVEVPKDWEEFLRVQEKLKGAGYIPCMVALVWAQDWAQDIIFDMLFHEVLELIDLEKGSPEEEAYLQGYLFPKEVSFLIRQGCFSPKVDRYVEVWRIIKEWRRHWGAEIFHTDRIRTFVKQRAAMIWEGSWLMRRLLKDPTIDFEWGIFYIPTITRETSSYAAGAEACVIGGAGTQFSVTNRARSDGELELAIDILRFLTRPGNAERIVGEGGMYIPNVRGAKVAPEVQPFRDILRRRYCTVKWLFSLDLEFTDVERRLIALFLEDGISLEGFLEELDRQMRAAADRMIAKEGWDFSGFQRTWQERKDRYWALAGRGRS